MTHVRHWAPVNLPQPLCPPPSPPRRVKYPTGTHPVHSYLFSLPAPFCHHLDSNSTKMDGKPPSCKTDVKDTITRVPVIGTFSLLPERVLWWVNCVSPPPPPPLSSGEVLPPGAAERDLIWKQGLHRGNQVTMTSLKWAPTQCDWYLYEKGQLGHRDTQGGRMRWR